MSIMWTENDTERALLAGVIAGAWRDGDCRRKLLADPVGVLTAAGLTLSAGCRVTVLEDTSTLRHVAIPPAVRLHAAVKEQFAALLAGLLPLAGGIELRLHQESENERFLVLSLPPVQDAPLSEDELKAVAGGMVVGVGGNGGTGGAGGNGGNGFFFVYGNGGNGGNGGYG